MVPRQHTIRRDPPNQIRFKNNILELMHPIFFSYFFISTYLITFISPLSLKHGLKAGGKSNVSRHHCEIVCVAEI